MSDEEAKVIAADCLKSAEQVRSFIKGENRAYARNFAYPSAANNLERASKVILALLARQAVGNEP